MVVHKIQNQVMKYYSNFGKTPKSVKVSRGDYRQLCNDFAASVDGKLLGNLVINLGGEEIPVSAGSLDQGEVLCE